MHVYVHAERDRPWLFGVGHCDYLNLVAGTSGIRCFIGEGGGIDAAYAADSAADKLLILYRDDGTFSVR
jgi:hypothetical protein